ncbi:SapC family protein [Plastoroseomonas arctica]|uniref:SapC family protein n=1 Tax=Plastoroseomonas arctica TaxID=1509237 RepID=A0AAF1K479_9PROT|nr:SapC family protein [Plastoroseomonas arctica]MBR0656418.1 SapC family protein [Plastoroseomonas arctica]
MSETNPAPDAGPIPAIFRAVEAVEAGRHAALRLDRRTGFAFARQLNAVPLGLTEIVAASEIPIVLSAGPVPVPVAVLGVRAEENLLVQEDGNWRPGAYVPGWLRCYPFLLLPATDAPDKLVLALESGAPLLGTEAGEPLFAEGQPTEILSAALRFAAAMRAALQDSVAFGRALSDAGLLRPQQADLTLRSGGSMRVDGFLTIDPEKLDDLPDETFLAWRRRGWVAPLYAILHSSPRWGRLLDWAAERATA